MQQSSGKNKRKTSWVYICICKHHVVICCVCFGAFMTPSQAVFLLSPPQTSEVLVQLAMEASSAWTHTVTHHRCHWFRLKLWAPSCEKWPVYLVKSILVMETTTMWGTSVVSYDINVSMLPFVILSTTMTSQPSNSSVMCFCIDAWIIIHFGVQHVLSGVCRNFQWDN